MTTHETIRTNGRPEEAWTKASKAQLLELRGWLLEQQSVAVANGLSGALLEGDFDLLASNTRATYRAILREYGPPGGTAPSSKRRRTSSGRRALQLVGAVVAAGSLASGAGIVAESRSAGAQGASEHPVLQSAEKPRYVNLALGAEGAWASGQNESRCWPTPSRGRSHARRTVGGWILRGWHSLRRRRR